jgi:hypothetical protein
VSRPDPHDLAAARARVSAVTDWIAARGGSNLPDPVTVDAAAGILAAPPHHSDVSVSVHPATVWRVGGHLVAVYHFGSLVGAVANAECSCPGKGLCEHTGTRRPRAVYWLPPAMGTDTTARAAMAISIPSADGIGGS